MQLLWKINNITEDFLPNKHNKYLSCTFCLPEAYVLTDEITLNMRINKHTNGEIGLVPDFNEKRF